MKKKQIRLFLVSFCLFVPVMEFVLLATYFLVSSSLFEK